MLLPLLTRGTRGILLSTPAGGTAGWATTGLVCQSFVGVKFLFTYGKGKFITTIAAYKDAVPVALIKHHGFLFPFLKKLSWNNFLPLIYCNICIPKLHYILDKLIMFPLGGLVDVMALAHYSAEHWREQPFGEMMPALLKLAM